MKSLIKNLGIFLLTWMSISATAQDVERSHFPPREQGWWTLGINGGWAYQSSDVPTTLEGYGFGMTLAKNMYYRPGGALSFDWRGRWLYSQSIGLDTKRATGLENNSALNGSRDAGEGLDYTLPAGPGYTFQNHKTHQFELGLEGVITANRLREQTGIIASVYGGLNADWYGTKIDQANNNGIYDYSGIDHINDSQSSIKATLKNNIRDGVYETNAHGNENGAGNIKIMPSLGAELGYQFTPRFSMHAGHKITFARTDDLDGELWTNNNNLTGGNDIHHYTNLGLRWIIDPAKNELEPPIINVTRPGTNPYISRSSAGRVDAKIKNVRNKIDVTCSVNGRPSNFSYNRGKFTVNFPLEYGENQVVITATNEVGTDEEIVIIYYGDGSTIPPVYNNPPRVRITTPSNSPYTSEYQDFTIKADIKYIQNKRDVEFFINGRNNYDFNYDNRNDQFSGTIRLQEGRNEIEIIARNEVGSDRDNVVIFYEKKIERPSVRITSPARTPYETTLRDFTVRAELENVNSKSDVRFFVNGREKSLFNYNTQSGRFTADLILERGRNEVVVRGRNEAGEAEDNATIIFQEENTPTARPPVVDITSPASSTYETTQSSINIRAQLQYVDRKNDVRFFVNGQERSLFSYIPTSGRFSADIILIEGRNDVEIKGYNEVGNDRDVVTIIYNKTTTPTGQPPLVKITSVSEGTSNPFEPNASGCRTTVIADVLRVNRKSDITFKVNGRTKTDFTYNASTNVFRSTITLDEGQNNISIRAINSYGSDEDSATKSCAATPPNAQPPVVTINNPVDNSTSTSATTNLNARVKHVIRKNDIRVKLNGSTINNFSFSPVSGVVTAQLTLTDGYNTISVWAKNDDGEDEASIRVRYNAPSNPPDVFISKPTDNSTTTNASAGLTATVKNVSKKSDITVKLNGKTINNFSFNSGQVTAQLTLEKGWNTISVVGKNSDGEDEASVRVRFNPPVNPPTVDITQPSNNSTTDTKVAVVKAKIMNVGGKGDIQFTFNGNNFNNFSYNNSSKILSANVTLIEGNNTITIKATTADGSDSESVKVKYVAPKVLPIVKITSPKNKTSTDKKSIAIKANIQNVASKSNVTFKVNGKKVNTFNYQRGTFKATVSLSKGKNTLRIEAKNNDGSDSDQVTVMYVPKVVLAKPVIKFITPSRPGTTAKKKKMSAKASVTNVTTKRQIKVTLNGRTTNFNFNSRKKEVTIPVILKTGTNAVSIVATNDAGQTTSETSLVWKDRPVSNIEKPTIDIVSVSTPAANPFNPNVSASTIIATVQNITDKKEITITHNGNAITDFTFDTRSKRLTVSINLAGGAGNKVIIKATNRAGSAEKEHTY